MSVRHIYVTVDEQDNRTAHVLMRGARLQCVSWQTGKVFRYAVTSKITGRDLFAALYNHAEFYDECVHLYNVENGSLREPMQD